MFSMFCATFLSLSLALDETSAALIVTQGQHCVTQSHSARWTKYLKKHQRGINKNLWFLRHLYFYDLEKKFFPFFFSRAGTAATFYFYMENICRLTTNLIWIENERHDTAECECRRGGGGGLESAGRVRKWCWKWANKDYINRRIWIKLIKNLFDI